MEDQIEKDQKVVVKKSQVIVTFKSRSKKTKKL